MRKTKKCEHIRQKLYAALRSACVRNRTKKIRESKLGIWSGYGAEVANTAAIAASCYYKMKQWIWYLFFCGSLLLSPHGASNATTSLGTIGIVHSHSTKATDRQSVRNEAYIRASQYAHNVQHSITVSKEQKYVTSKGMQATNAGYVIAYIIAMHS